MNLFKKILQLQEQNISLALVTVVAAKGSVPRGVGSKMVVTERDMFGTVGGGAVENLVINEARAALSTQKARLVSHNLDDADGSDTGMICGGTMDFFIEPIGTLQRLIIFGGGHVGLHLSRFADILGLPYIVSDDRDAFCNAERFPSAIQLWPGNPEKIAAEHLTSEDMVVIVTRDHELDYVIVREALKKKPRYIGLIGGQRKRRAIYDKLSRQDGVRKDELEQIHSPVGLDIAAETPQEIALSIAAELIKEKNT